MHCVQLKKSSKTPILNKIKIIIILIIIITFSKDYRSSEFNTLFKKNIATLCVCDTSSLINTEFCKEDLSIYSRYASEGT